MTRQELFTQIHEKIGTDVKGDVIDDLMGLIDQYTQGEIEVAANAAYDDAKLSEQEMRDEIEGEVRDDIQENLQTALSLIDTDRESARVYRHRATGSYVFNIGEKQACLL